MSNEIFDFGFTAVNEDELDAVQRASKEAELNYESADKSQSKLNELYNAIQPLLTNLKLNPEKDYIYWPDRLTKVESFEEYILEIYTK
jgi:hypothetical protein